jgi:ribosomal protein L11 methyltransferase
VGVLTIAPPWSRGGRDPGRTIFIEPAMAFGTGDHASTRGALRLLHSAIRPGYRVADLGAGSAILAIAAAKLGAGRVAAIELDPDAIGNALDNVRENAVGDRVTVIEGDAGVLLPLLAPVDLVLANIISSVIVALLAVIAGALSSGGRAVFAGLLDSEREMMLGVFRNGGWAVAREDREGDWWSVSVTRA